MDRVVLSNSENEKIERAFNKAARWAYAQKKTELTPDDLQDKNVQPLINEINNLLQNALQSSIGYEIPEAMHKHLRDNIYVFSGCKTYAELQELSDLLVDDEGNIKGFSKFFKDTREIHNTYNRNYLESEYLFATQSARMAGKWADYEQYGDRYYLQYRTANDSRVRYEHSVLHNITLPQSDEFWNNYYPPNGWRCRCNVVQVRKSKYEPSDSTTAQDLGSKATYTVGKGGVNTSAIFRFNAGKQKIIFPLHHPYFKNKEVVKVSKDIASKKTSEKTDKAKRIINLSEYIKGDEPTNKEVKNILTKYAELESDDFRRGLDNVSFRKSRSYLMQHSMSYKPKTGEWSSGSTIAISTHDFSVKINGKYEVFNPAKELKEALAAIKRGDELTFNQEYSIESLWHEILHGKTKSKPFDLSSGQRQTMETVNQFCARHTYDKFIEKLGGKASHKDTILDNGLGYQKWVADFRKLLKDNEISEDKAVKELMPKLLSDYSTINKEAKDFLEKNKKKDD